MGHRRRRAGAATLALVLAFVVAACGGTSSPPLPESPLQALRTALRERAALLAKGDAEAYLQAAVGPARAVEEAIARGAAAVPLSYANVSVEPIGSAGGANLRQVRVEMVFRYEGLPRDNLFRFGLRYDVERRAGSWVITASTPEPDPPLPVWAREPVESTRTEHFLALHRPGLAKAREALDLAEQARARLVPKLRYVEPESADLLLLGADHADLERMLGRPVSAGVLAVANALYPGIGEPEHRQMAVNLDALLGSGVSRILGHSGTGTAVEVFQHELAHLALVRLRGRAMPAWVNEGTAMYLSGERRVAEWRAGLARGAFDAVSIAALGNNANLPSSLEYAYANAAVLYLVERFGDEQFWRFYSSFRRLVPTGEFATDSSRFALRQSFGLTAEELDTATRDWMRRAAAG